MKHILLCDDQPFLTETFAVGFTRPDLRISIVAHGAQAIDTINHDPPDLLVLDVLMPVMNGFDVLEEYARHDWKFPVIVVSNIDRPEDVQRCRAWGATAFLCKNKTSMRQLQGLVLEHLGLPA